MQMVKYGKLMDAHVHIDPIVLHHPDAQSQFRSDIDSQGTWYPAKPISDYVGHIMRNEIDTMVALYENPATLRLLREAAPGCKIFGFKWIREIHGFKHGSLDELYLEGLLQGIKLHPVFDRYELTTENLADVLKTAREYKLPVLYHSDDRAESMHLTAPGLQEALVRQNPDVTFLIGHTGAYTPRMDDWPIEAIRSYWKEGNYSPVELIQRALRLALEHDNAFCDLTIVTNQIKAETVKLFVEEHPEVAGKILVGTDYPIDETSLIGQIHALEEAGLRPDLIQQIASNRPFH
jgi:hypothetical protein